MKKLQILNSSIFVLNQKLNNIHFNYKGDNFRDIHLFTEEAYKIGLELYDDVSEKIAMNNAIVKASLSEHLNESKIEDLKGSKFTKGKVSNILVKDFTSLIKITKQVEGIETIQPLLDEVYMWADKYRWIFKSME